MCICTELIEETGRLPAGAPNFLKSYKTEGGLETFKLTLQKF